ncbi:hypothetical protein GALL_188870 [mine drainage metagenome]|uniref:Uncharacterized protein n=1 Tax=mine drainage metagenome TaxID=410659 RepID=A0A1J5SG48_9ZZZZ
MKRSIIFAALSLAFVTNVMAGETNSTNINRTIASQAVNRTIASQAVKHQDNLIVAVTEPGKVAADTAWLLSGKARENPKDKPVLLVLKTNNRLEMLKSLKLSETDLPALIYLDSDGNILDKVINAAPSTKVYLNTGNNANSLS